MLLYAAITEKHLTVVRQRAWVVSDDPSKIHRATPIWLSGEAGKASYERVYARFG
jgi:hypothetical protein